MRMQVALSVVQRGLRPVIPATCSPAQASIIRVSVDRMRSVWQTVFSFLCLLRLASDRCFIALQ